MKTIKKVLLFLKPYKKDHFIAILASLLEGTAYLIMPYAFKIFIDQALINKDKSLVYKSLSSYFLIVLLAILLGFIKVILTNRTVQKATKDARINLFKVIRNCPLKTLNQHKTGTLMSYFVTDSVQMANGLGITLIGFLQNIMRIIAGIIVLGSINIKILLLLLLFLPLYLLDVLVFSNAIKRSTIELQNQNAIISESLQENLSASAEILVLNKQNWEIRNMKAIFNKQIDLSVKTSILSQLSSNLGFLIYWFVHICVFLIGSKYVINGEMTIGTLILYGAYMDNIYMPCKLLIQDNINLQKSLASGERYFDLVRQLSHFESLAPYQSTIINTFRDKIEVKNVSFKYNDEYVLKDLSFTINKGEVIAIIGPSGSGKSTLLKLLLNFYKTSSGSITIDEIDVNSIDNQSLYSITSVAFQDVFLFDGSIKDNIAFSNDSASLDNIIQIAKQSGAHDFIEKTEHGYFTSVGERGSKLSGGQKQRLSIARSLIRDSEIYLFDEPTSALDKKNKSILMNTIQRLKKRDKTIIFVTHDLSNLMNVDKVIHLKSSSEVEIIKYKNA